MISGLRLTWKSFSPPGKFFIAAVAISVAGQRLLEAIPSFLNSSAQAAERRLILYLLRVYATWGLNHFISKFRGGDSVRICGFGAFFQQRVSIFGDHKSSPHIDIEHQVKSFGFCSFGIAEADGRCIVYHDIQPSKMGHRFFHQVLNQFFIPDITK